MCVVKGFFEVIDCGVSAGKKLEAVRKQQWKVVFIDFLNL